MNILNLKLKKQKKTTKKIELVNSVENIFGENYITEDWKEW